MTSWLMSLRIYSRQAGTEIWSMIRVLHRATLRLSMSALVLCIFVQSCQSGLSCPGKRAQLKRMFTKCVIITLEQPAHSLSTRGSKCLSNLSAIRAGAGSLGWHKVTLHATINDCNTVIQTKQTNKEKIVMLEKDICITDDRGHISLKRAASSSLYCWANPYSGEPKSVKKLL